MNYIPEFKKGGSSNWIQKAVNPAHKGFCTPMTKATCTPKRKAFAETMKKHHGFQKKQEGGPVEKMTSSPVAAQKGAKVSKKYQVGGLINEVKTSATQPVVQKPKFNPGALAQGKIASDIKNKQIGVIDSAQPPVTKDFNVVTLSGPTTKPVVPTAPVIQAPKFTRPINMQPMVPKPAILPGIVGLQKPQITNPFQRMGVNDVRLFNNWPTAAKQGDEAPIGEISIPGLRAKDKWSNVTLTKGNWGTYANALPENLRAGVNKKYNIDAFLNKPTTAVTTENPYFGNEARVTGGTYGNYTVK